MALPVTLVTLGGMPVELVDQTGSVFPTTGTGSLVFNTTPTLITPILGAATGTSLALGGAALVGNALAVTGTTSLSNGTATFDAVGNAVMASANIGSYVSIHFGVAGQILTRSTGLYAFSANATITGGGDTALSRISAGIIGVGTGAAGNVAGGLQAATLALGGATIASTFSFAATGNFQIGVGGGSLFFTNASRIDDNNGSGLFRLFNAGASSGIGLGVTTNGVLAVRTSNNGADGAITASSGTFSTSVTWAYGSLDNVSGGQITMGGNTRIRAQVTGTLTIADVTSGYQAVLNTTTVNGSLGINGAGNYFYSNNAAFVASSKTTLTNGAAAQVGTLTNAPASGNPTKWIGIDDNGTTRYIPAW